MTATEVLKIRLKALIEGGSDEGFEELINDDSDAGAMIRGCIIAMEEYAIIEKEKVMKENETLKDVFKQSLFHIGNIIDLAKAGAYHNFPDPEFGHFGPLVHKKISDAKEFHESIIKK